MNGKVTDAAPVAWLIYWSSTELEAPELTRNAGRVTEIMAFDKPPRVEPLYTHLQPAKPEAVRLRDELRERAQFEAWARQQTWIKDCQRYEGRDYGHYETQKAWAAWQAALAATGKQQVGEVHPDDVAVDAFAEAMKQKMADARAKGRGGWEDPTQCSAVDLNRLLRDHVEKGDPRDVANFCMMLHQRGESIVAYLDLPYMTDDGQAVQS